MSPWPKNSPECNDFERSEGVLLKLNYDGTHRLLPTLGIMRLWDYDFVANTALPTLLEEMVHLNVLPHRINLIIDLLTIE
jgi:hypothetical protein